MVHGSKSIHALVEIGGDYTLGDDQLHDRFEQPCSGGEGLFQHKFPIGLELEFAHLNCEPSSTP
jgi:hypothetical protein